MKDKEGRMMSENEAVEGRWKEYFEQSMRRDKEKYVRGLAEEAEDHLNANGLRSAY